MYYVVTDTIEIGPFPTSELAESFASEVGGKIRSGKYNPRALSPLAVLPDWELAEEYAREHLRWSREILRPAQETTSEL